MGEQPIFTTKAHVFHIDPVTKKNWIPSSTGAVNVSFYYDSNRSTYRIISVDGSKAIINSTVVPSMSFTKTSQKFGQWSDARANTVYGLGFSNEAELNKFTELFNEVRDLAKQQAAPPKSLTASLPQPNGECGDVPLPVQVTATTGGSVQNSEYMTPVLDRHSTSGLPSNGSAAFDGNSQLKYENDRLKIALAQSSQNAKKWEVELQTLKNNNARLTAALQESTTNVDEWKKQLAAYKEDNARLKKLLIELERNQPTQQEEVNSMQKQLTDLMEKMNISETEKRNTQHELEQLRFQANQVSRLEENNRLLDRQNQELRKENMDLDARLRATVTELELARSNQSKEKLDMVKVLEVMRSHIPELVNAQNQLAKLLNS